MATLGEYQEWVKEAWNTSPKRITERDELLFLMEEIGEMAEAVRKINGNKNTTTDIEKEFGDILLSVITLALRYGIDLETAFEKTKESIVRRYVR